MAQHDYIIANQSGAAFRSDLNNGLAAIVSQNSGAAQPSTTYAYQWWADTTTGLLKIRNSGNNAWITVGTLANSNLGLAPLASPTFTGNVTINAQGDLRLADSDSSNWVALQAPATVASNLTLTVPAADGTADQSLVTDGAGALSFASRSRLVRGTAVATTSGTSIDFTSIPSWAKRITVNLVGTSTNGTSAEIIRIGDSSGFSASSYVGTTSFLVGGVSPICGVNTLSDGFNLMGQTASTPTNNLTAKVVIELVAAFGGINYWVASGVISRIDGGNVYQKFVAGYKGLTGTLDRVQLTTITGTASFDGGSVNIIYEG